MNKVLTDFGYVYYGSCSCDGQATYKYKKGSYKIKWRYKKGTFKVLSQGSTIISWTPVGEAENILKETHAEVAV